jgi:hypothetical protein
MQAPKIETQTLPPPPGIIGSIRAGFDVTTGHITAILMPVILDVLLWLGPRLSMYNLAQKFLDILKPAMNANPSLQPADVTSLMTAYQQTFKAFNLLALLRSFPIGITSIMSSKLPGLSPLGAPASVQVDSPTALMGIIFLLTLIGWTLGSLYFRWVGALVNPESAPSMGRGIVHTLILSVIWVAISWVIGLPIIFVISIVYAINSVVGEIILLILAFISMWLIVPIFFSPHGIFVKKQNAFASIVSSFQLARFTLPTSSLFILVVFVLSFGSNILWSIPDPNSWLMAVGILGHAFITTALLASTFVYYQDMTSWLQTILARLRNGLPQKQA